MDTYLRSSNDSEIYCRVRSDSSSRTQRLPDEAPHELRSQSSDHRHPSQYLPREPHLAPYSAPVAAPALYYNNHSYNDMTIERTPAGNSILSALPSELPIPSSVRSIHQQNDLSAAARVENSFRRTPHDSKYERILRGLIRRDEPLDSGFMLDDPALESILTAADSLFFDGTLAGRVKWEWSSDPRYRTEVIGTTALRQCTRREGFETLIILSEPLLRSHRYDRRLLLTAFLHELIHCYLFISCGFEARMDGGHTQGFYQIADIIDNWVGPGYLSICKNREDPERYKMHTPSQNRRSEYSNYMLLETSQCDKINKFIFVKTVNCETKTIKDL